MVKGQECEAINNFYARVILIYAALEYYIYISNKRSWLSDVSLKTSVKYDRSEAGLFRQLEKEDNINYEKL